MLTFRFPWYILALVAFNSNTPRHMKASIKKERNMPYFIYALTGPNTGTVAYIGITNNTERRFRQHLLCDGTNMAKDAWVQGLLKRGVKPLLDILETVDTRTEAQKRERYWVKYYKEQQVYLRNISLNISLGYSQDKNAEKGDAATKNEQQATLINGQLYYTTSQARAKLGLSLEEFHQSVQGLVHKVTRRLWSQQGFRFYPKRDIDALVPLFNKQRMQ